MVEKRERGGTPRRLKPIGLPKITAADVDLAHIREAHLPGGVRAGASKTLFPAGWSEHDVLSAVLAAYTGGKRIETQGQRVRVLGESRGLSIEMWVNLISKRIETAYPV